jgi:hypothetical protein
MIRPSLTIVYHDGTRAALALPYAADTMAALNLARHLRTQSHVCIETVHYISNVNTRYTVNKHGEIDVRINCSVTVMLETV